MVFIWCVGVLFGVVWAPFVEVSSSHLLVIGLVWVSFGFISSMRWFVILGTSVWFGFWLVVSQPVGPEWSGRMVVQGVMVSAGQGKEANVLVKRHKRIGGEWISGTGRVSVRFKESPPRMGLPVLIMGRAVNVTRPVLPGAPDPVISARRAGVRTRIIVEDSVVIGPSTPSWLTPRYVNDGVMTAVATGERSRISSETNNLLRKTGTAHLLAISGFHVGVVGLGATWVFEFLYEILFCGAIYNVNS